MAVATANISMGPRQRELRSFVVVERRGFPLGAVVAVGAGSHIVLGELSAVRIGMAFLALERRVGEVGVDQFGAEVCRLMAIDAGHGAMRADERKFRFRVIETDQILPAFRRVAGLAADRRSVCSKRFHPLGKLIVVRIFVARGACLLLEMENGRRSVVRRFGNGHILHRSRCREQDRSGKGRGRFVALATQDGKVPVVEWKARLLMFGERERGRLESFDRVTLLALVEPGRGGELCLMLIAMTIQAPPKLDRI